MTMAVTVAMPMIVRMVMIMIMSVAMSMIVPVLVFSTEVRDGMEEHITKKSTHCKRYHEILC